MSVSLLGPDDYKAMPWANGRGTTLEFASETCDGRLLWRFSQASVVEDGAFSVFSGIDRIIMLVSGPGFRLDFGASGSADVVDPFRPVSFSGDWRTVAGGVTAPCEDMNVMTARGLAEARVRIHSADSESPASDRSLFLAHRGDWRLEFQEVEHDIRQGSAALIRAARGSPVRIQGAGVLVEVAITLSA